MTLTVTPKNVAMLIPSMVIEKEAGETLELDQYVYIKNTDGKAYVARANTAAASNAIGKVVSVNRPGDTTAPAGQKVGICTFGRCAGKSGMTPGAILWLSAADAGEATETKPTGAGTWSRGMGYAESEDIEFIMPGITAPPSNS